MQTYGDDIRSAGKIGGVGECEGGENRERGRKIDREREGGREEDGEGGRGREE